MDRLDEALQICRLMFTEERPSFAGRFHRIERALNNPRPIQPGGPPIMIGGTGEQRTLRLTARHADISNWIAPLADLPHKVEVLERHCEAVGRDPATILRTVTVPLVLVQDHRDAGAQLERLGPEIRPRAIVATPAEAPERLQPYLELGFRGIMLRNPTLRSPDEIGLAGELIGLMRGAITPA